MALGGIIPPRAVLSLKSALAFGMMPRAGLRLKAVRADVADYGIKRKLKAFHGICE